MNQKLQLVLVLSYVRISRPEPSCKEELNKIICNGIINTFPNKVAHSEQTSLQCDNCSIKILSSSTISNENIDLNILNISNSEMEILESSAFDRMHGIQYLYFENNKITNISKNAFRNLYNLKEVKLSNNRIWDLGFGEGLAVEVLDLDHNQIVEIPNNTFYYHYQIITNLTFSHNNIKIIHEDSFRGLRNLRFLFLNDNEICYLPIGVFKELKYLQYLNLGNNKLTNLNLGTFSCLEDVTTLILANNSLETLSGEELIPLKSLQQLDVAGNKIHEIDVSRLFYSIPSIKKISIENNLFSCSLVMKVIKKFKEKVVEIIVQNGLYNVQNIKGIACFKESIDYSKPFLSQILNETLKAARYC